MVLADAGAGVVTAVLAVLLVADRLSLPLLYAGMVAMSLFSSFRWPAYSAAISLLVPKRQLGRASGLDQFGQAASQLLAPVAAGVLVAAIGAHGVLAIDVLSYGVALAALAAARVPDATREPAPARDQASLLGQARVGLSFIAARRGLLALLLYLAAINLLAGFNLALATPLVLSLASPVELGAVLAASAAGLLVGGLLLGALGGPRERMRGVLGFGVVYGASFLAVGLRPSLPLIAAASFLLMFPVPVINGCSQVIWQSKVPLELQGRVFAVRRMIAQATLPIAFLAAGPLADRVFTPLLVEAGPLAGSVGRLLGTGPGRGIGFLYVVLGTAFLAVGSLAALSRRLRQVERDLPDCLPEVPAGPSPSAVGAG
jgi:MFS family permease